MRRAFSSGRGLDHAIRSWAAEDVEIANAVAEVDTRRVGYIARLLVDGGCPAERAEDRATFLYWAYLGQPAAATLLPPAIDDISALFEGR